MYIKYWDAIRTASEAKKMAKEIARTAQVLKDENSALREKVKALEEVEVEYSNWKKREPEVRHFLKSFAGIAK